jgi:anhydro-N-acetylmuramic acid kinase
LYLLREIGERPDQIDLIASHGQTVWYDAPTDGQLGSVLALGEPAIIAERTGITTISNFRSRDLAVGGFGAPLVGYMDWLLFRHPTQTRAIQNIGGIGNVTFLPPLNMTSDPVVFDTGPGNMIIDYCARRATGDVLRYDKDGQLAAQGKVNAALLADLMQHPYLSQLPPKTTGRETFGAQYGESVWMQAQRLGLTANDILATVTAFTAETITDAYRRFLPEPVTELFIAGGGAQNPTLLAMLRGRLPEVIIQPHEQLGIPADAKECVLFALLGYETWHGRPGTLPMLTGASHPVILGNITPGRRMPGRVN